MDGREKAEHGRHGIALIINNIEWEKDENGKPYMSNRDGAKDGAAALKKSLEEIGYKVKVKENLTGDQMKEKLKKAREAIDTADDSFICCISTHGDEDGVYGIDGRSRKRRPANGDKHKPVSIEDLSKILEPDVCKKLSRKPKIFFIQACRGGTVSEPTDDPNEEEPPVPPINVVPRGADYYFSYATDPGHLALRKDYLKYLSQALKKKLSLDEIVMSVHEGLASRVATVRNGEEHLQIGQVVHTMRGPVYF